MIEDLINELGDLCHESYLGCEPINPSNDEYSYGYKKEVIWLLNTPEGKAIIKKYFEKLIDEMTFINNDGYDNTGYLDELKQTLRDKYL